MKNSSKLLALLGLGALAFGDIKKQLLKKNKKLTTY